MASKHCGDAPVLYSGKQGSIPWPASILLVQNIYRGGPQKPDRESGSRAIRVGHTKSEPREPAGGVLSRSVRKRMGCKTYAIRQKF